jgi:tetratricopeptide (TPR) repeat protein
MRSRIFILAALTVLACGHASAAEAKVRAMELGLRVHVKNDLGGEVFIKGVPIYFSVSISNKTVEDHYGEHLRKRKESVVAAIRAGLPPEKDNYKIPEKMKVMIPAHRKGWARAVELTLYKLDEAGKTRTKVLPDLDWSKLVTRDQTLKAVGEIDARKVLAAWCITPEHSSRLDPGKYEIVAKYGTSGIKNPLVARGDLTGAATFLIMKPKNPKEEKLKVTYEMARYHLKKEEWDKCIEFARKSLAAEESYEGYEVYRILGAAYEGKEMWKEAIVAYELYLKHNPEKGAWTVPAMIKRKVEALKRK